MQHTEHLLWLLDATAEVDFSFQHCEHKAYGTFLRWLLIDELNTLCPFPVVTVQIHCAVISKSVDATSVLYDQYFLSCTPKTLFCIQPFKLVFVHVQCVKESCSVKQYFIASALTVVERNSGLYVCQVNVYQTGVTLSAVTVLLNALVGLKWMQTCIIDRNTVNISN